MSITGPSCEITKKHLEERRCVVNPEVIGLLSGSIVIVSIVPYASRTYQAKIRPNPTSWALWAAIGGAILATYKSSGAEANVWPAVFGFSNTLLITTLIIWRKGKWERPTMTEWICIVVCLSTIALWAVVHDNQGLAQFALYLAIIADVCAMIPTWILVWNQPDADRPFAWGMFGIGYGLGALAITEHTFANYALPAWMVLGSFVVTMILMSYRFKKQIPLREWI